MDIYQWKLISFRAIELHRKSLRRKNSSIIYYLMNMVTPRYYSRTKGGYQNDIQEQKLAHFMGRNATDNSLRLLLAIEMIK